MSHGARRWRWIVEPPLTLTPRTFMVIAGEASGDALAGELLVALRHLLIERGADASQIQFYGVGGEKVRAAGAELIFDLTHNAVFGLEALTRIFEFKRQFQALLKVARERQPDGIICVDFSGFNRRFAHAVKQGVRSSSGGGWDPKIVQYVSPQVWASRPGRAAKLARDIDLLLTIFPFEKKWYSDRLPALRVEFVGHPVVDRYAVDRARGAANFVGAAQGNEVQRLVVLPGSRPSELQRHLPILRSALHIIRQVKPNLQVTMVMGEHLLARARAIGLPENVTVRSSGLGEALANADVAIAKSGTITLECAFFGVPTVTLYKTSWATYELARRIVKVRWIAMPNILANEEVFPEFVQDRATPENIANATLDLLTNLAHAKQVRTKLRDIASSLGDPGASRRAAAAILSLF